MCLRIETNLWFVFKPKHGDEYERVLQNAVNSFRGCTPIRVS
jgi:hypothetical protein